MSDERKFLRESDVEGLRNAIQTHLARSRVTIWEARYLQHLITAAVDPVLPRDRSMYGMNIERGPEEYITPPAPRPKLQEVIEDVLRFVPTVTSNPRAAAEGDVQREGGPVNHPSHYNRGGIEVIDFLDAYFPDDPHLWQAGKYISRAGEKDPDKFGEDLQKAIWYIQRRYDQWKAAQ